MLAETLLLLMLVLFSAMYVRRRVGTRLSLTVLLFGTLWLVHGVPLLVYVYLTGPDTFIFEKALEHVDRTEILSRLLLAVSVMLACLMAGAEIANRSFPRWHRAAANSGGFPMVQLVRISPVQRVLLWLVVLAMLAVSLEQSHLANVLEYFRFSGSEADRAGLRRDLGGTPYYAYNVVLYSIAPFLVMVSYCQDLRSSARRWPGALTVALFTAVMLGKFGTLSKAPPVIFILQLILLHVMLNNPALKFGLLVRLFLAALVLFMVITQLTLPELGVWQGLAFLYYRVFDIPNEVLLEYFSAIPSAIAHSWGGAFFRPLLGEPGSDGLETYFAVAEVTRGSILSSSNAMFIGDAWAQFSWYGVIATSAAAAFLVRTIDLYGQRNGHTDRSACLTAGCSFGIFTILSTSFTTGLVTGGLAIIPLLSAVFAGRPRAASTRGIAPRSAEI